MGFERADYLSWYLPRAFSDNGALNLHASGVARIDPESLKPADVPMDQAVSALERALADWQGIAPERVVFTPGATGGTLLALLALVLAGDEVLVERPIYEPMLRQAMRLGRVHRLDRPRDGAFGFDLDQAAGLIGDRTSLVMITEPHNPSGILSARDDVLALARLAADRGALVLINEVYRGFTDARSYDGVADNIVVVSSMSKLLGAYWARIGWLSAHPAVAARLRAAHMNIGMPAGPVARWGPAIVERAEALRLEARTLAADGKACVERFVAKTPAIGWTPPAGPGFATLNLLAGVDDVALAEQLHDLDGVLTVPGTFFDLPGTLRVGWLQAGAGLEAGLARLAERLSTCRRNGA